MMRDIPIETTEDVSNNNNVTDPDIGRRKDDHDGNIEEEEEDDDYIVHDQLPDVEEYRASQSGDGTSSSPIRTKAPLCYISDSTRVILYFFGTILFFFLWITILVVAMIDTEGPEESSIPNPQTMKEIRVGEVREFIEQYQLSETNDLYTVDSPQFKASEWIADIDKYQVEISVSNEFIERYAVAVFYYAMDGINWNYDARFLSETHICDWYTFFSASNKIPVKVGIICESSTEKRVNQLFLPTNELHGKIPHEIRLLQQLNDLNLFNNYIKGTIPGDAISELTSLRSLVLHDNNMDGYIPSSLYQATNLRMLNIASNNILGEFHQTIRQLTSLTSLNVNSNDMTGNLNVLYNMTNLISLQLDDNNFEGSLPDELLSSWSSLSVLDISHNEISGIIPTSLFESQTIEVIDLSDNELNGLLPSKSDYGEKIRFLALQSNQLTGPIDRITVLKTLVHLDLSDNYFTGTIPTELGLLKQLRYLFISYNPSFTYSTIPTELGSLTELVDLSLQDTNRTGPIPGAFLQNLSNLVMLDLNENSLNETLPTEISYLTNLQYLMIQNNPSLTGSIPSLYGVLSKLETFLIVGTQITSGTDYLCVAIPKLQELVADCSNWTDPCGTCCRCCPSVIHWNTSADTTGCSDVWYSGIDPVQKYQYTRGSYLFHDEDIVIPYNKSIEQDADYYDDIGNLPGDLPSADDYVEEGLP